MPGPIAELVKLWMEWGQFDPEQGPDLATLEAGFPDAVEPTRPPADPSTIAAWEERHGFRLPAGLRAWLMLSNGLYQSTGPLIHPISAIGPMVPFATVPDMLIQPESWFELGNPNLQTICIDLAYRLPNGGNPIFTSGDDALASPPRIIASSFEEWFLNLLRQGGREFWFDADFEPLGAPWALHRMHAPHPAFPSRLCPYLDRAAALLADGLTERQIADRLTLNLPDVELLLRQLQRQNAAADSPDHDRIRHLSPGLPTPSGSS
jgi:hypothetical protein